MSYKASIRVYVTPDGEVYRYGTLAYWHSVDCSLKKTLTVREIAIHNAVIKVVNEREKGEI